MIGFQTSGRKVLFQVLCIANFLVAVVPAVQAKQLRLPVRQMDDRTLQSCALNSDFILATAPCTPFSAFLQNLGYPLGTTEFSSRITIPCGQCVKINSDSTNINYIFRDGIDIQGKLVLSCYSSSNTIIPSTWTSTMQLQSTAVIVQGQLHIDGTCKPIDGIPLVQISMIDKDLAGTSSTFVPIHSAIMAK
jgi:hypothetical protein